jgi:hypothetical protein
LQGGKDIPLVDPVVPAGLGDGMEGRDVTADAEHSMPDHHRKACRPPPHDFFHGHVRIDLQRLTSVLVGVP